MAGGLGGMHHFLHLQSCTTKKENPKSGSPANSMSGDWLTDRLRHGMRTYSYTHASTFKQECKKNITKCTIELEPIRYNEINISHHKHSKWHFS